MHLLLVQNASCIDAGIHQMHRNPAMFRVALGQCPVTAMYPPVFRGNADMGVDKDRVGGFQGFTANDAGTVNQYHLRIQ